MRTPPPIAAFRLFPVTGGIILFAIVATIRWWTGGNVDRFDMTFQAWTTQPWRLVTPALFHAGVIHLLFNVYWIWVFGTCFEARYGPTRTAATYLLLAAGSNVAEYALFYGGVGLSGVGYGLFGFFWIAGRRDPRLAGIVDRATIQLFVGWFLLCIVLTAAKVMPVANVAHGVGAALGAMLGWTATAQSARARIGHVALLAGSVAAIAVAGSVGRPYVNLAGRAGDDYEAAALDALQNGRYSRAIELYRKALAINAHEPRWWHNLGVACFRADRLEEALEAFRRAAELAPMDPKHQAALSAMTGQMSEEAGQPGANAQGESPSGR